MSLRPGDIVQLRSGGAPLTVCERIEHAFDNYMYRCVAMSPGGLMQEVFVPAVAVTPYQGAKTQGARW